MSILSNTVALGCVAKADDEITAAEASAASIEALVAYVEEVHLRAETLQSKFFTGSGPIGSKQKDREQFAAYLAIRESVSRLNGTKRMLRKAARDHRVLFQSLNT